jgi:hypothetical protein
MNFFVEPALPTTVTQGGHSERQGTNFTKTFFYFVNNGGDENKLERLGKAKLFVTVIYECLE